MRVPLLAATLVLAAPLTSCNHVPSPGRPTERAAPRDRGATAAGAPAEAKDAVANEAELQQGASVPPLWSDPAADPASRLIIRTGQAGIEVDSLEPALDRLRATAARVGGFVGNASIQTGRNQVRQASVEIKVPSSRFDDLTEGLRPLGRVEFLTVGAEDVSEEFVDLTARTANARRMEERLLELLASRTGKLQDVLTVERELARVREEIERMEGRLRYLKTRTELSTLSVALHEPPPLVSPVPGRNPLAQAVREAWQNFVGVLAAGIASLGYLVPVSLLGWGVVIAGRRLTRRPA
ncbi:MAG TPA: DUF4349 domain-containing protein [Gemmatimonadales bacterium]|nr:DUF4349 domain-containing protein [Gemmatimonadales bacterium]